MTPPTEQAAPGAAGTDGDLAPANPTATPTPPWARVTGRFSPRTQRRFEWVGRTSAAALAGLAMYSAFPPRNWWFMAVISLGILYALLSQGQPRARTGAWLGFVFGLGFFVPLLPWIGVYVGPLPWLALAALLAGYLALFGGCATVTMRLPAPPIWFAVTWILVEGLRSSFPFGGFPWGRAAFSQVDGPLLPLASVVGAPGVSGAVALFGAAVVWVMQLAVHRNRAPGTGARSPVGTAALAIVLALLAPISAIALTPDTIDRNVARSSVHVAAIQGNVPRLGLDFNAQRRAVLDNHVRETMRLAEEIRAGSAEQPDLVAWPENASDIDPLANPDAAEEITAASVAVGAPIMVGTLILEPDGRPTNTVLVWDGLRGPIARYDKHIIQPFGEYLPWRPFFRMFSSYADRAGNFRPGTGPSVLTVPGRSGDVTVGVATCWEIAFDRAAQTSVSEGAQILYVPTNNATFGRTDMTYQQLAMSQFRAVEHGRAVIVAATSGASALIEPDGSVAASSRIFTPAILADRLPLSSTVTIATRLGAWPERIAMVIAVLALLVAGALRTRFTQRFTAVRPRNGTGTVPDTTVPDKTGPDKSEEFAGDQ